MEEDGQDAHMKQRVAWGGEGDEWSPDHLRDGTDGEQAAFGFHKFTGADSALCHLTNSSEEAF